MSKPSPLHCAWGGVRAARTILVLSVVVALRGTVLLGDGLEVVPPPDRGVVEAIRGRRLTVPLVLRNTGTGPVEVQSLFYRSAEGSPTAPPPVVLGLDGTSLAAGQSTTVALVLPTYSTVGEYSGGLYLKSKTDPDNERLVYAFKVKVREPPVTVLGSKAAGWLASLFAVLVCVLTLYVRVPVNDGAKKLNFFQSPDGEYSVSRFQVWLWTIVILFSYGFLFLSNGASPEFPDSIWALLGISVASVGTATTMAVKGKPEDPQPAVPPNPPPEAPAVPPEPVARPPAAPQSPLVNMLSEEDKPSIMRLQMFAWTIAAAVFFVVHVYKNGQLWDVPSNLLILMGISHAGYLVDKAALQSRK
jgi:hypothetical protein